jgi:hypothetical protein
MTEAVNLIKNRKRRGEWAELRFMAAAAEHGLSVSKPWGESDRYDVGVEHNGRYQRVQVKSLTQRVNHSFRCGIGIHGRTRSYTTNELDFFAIFIIPAELWYLVPAHVAIGAGKHSIVLTPSLKKNRYEVYREAWHLLRGRRSEPSGCDAVVEGQVFQVE